MNNKLLSIIIASASLVTFGSEERNQSYAVYNKICYNRRDADKVMSEKLKKNYLNSKRRQDYNSLVTGSEEHNQSYTVYGSEEHNQSYTVYGQVCNNRKDADKVMSEKLKKNYSNSKRHQDYN